MKDAKKMNLSLSDSEERKYPLATKVLRSHFGKKTDLVMSCLNAFINYAIQEICISEDEISDPDNLTLIFAEIDKLLASIISVSASRKASQLYETFQFSCDLNNLDSSDDKLIKTASYYLLSPENIKKVYDMYWGHTDKTVSNPFIPAPIKKELDISLDMSSPSNTPAQLSNTSKSPTNGSKSFPLETTEATPSSDDQNNSYYNEGNLTDADLRAINDL